MTTQKETKETEQDRIDEAGKRMDTESFLQRRRIVEDAKRLSGFRRGPTLSNVLRTGK